MSSCGIAAELKVDAESSCAMFKGPELVSSSALKYWETEVGLCCCCIFELMAGFVGETFGENRCSVPTFKSDLCRLSLLLVFPRANLCGTDCNSSISFMEVLEVVLLWSVFELRIVSSSTLRIWLVPSEEFCSCTCSSRSSSRFFRRCPTICQRSSPFIQMPHK